MEDDDDVDLYFRRDRATINVCANCFVNLLMSCAVCMHACFLVNHVTMHMSSYKCVCMCMYSKKERVGMMSLLRPSV